jgi:hypothetical protein
LFRSEGAREGGRSGIAQFFLEETVELDLVFSRVFFLLVDDEGGIMEGPVADGFTESLKGLGVGDPDQDSISIFMGQFLDPSGEEKIILFYILRIIIDVLVIPLVL